ncbi:MAG: ATP-binding cassette domain-containing protein, partial [Clostridia bacterium]|nr:ATP-binding cassette domain-containing protein [Clostridia bacterium]
YDMSVSEKQTLEIVKILYRGADILILDEPTAVLTPQETEKLFAVMRTMKADGKSIVIITHKLHEVMEISDRVAVLRRGEFVGEVATKDTNPQKLTEMMVGRAVSLNIDRPEPKNLVERLVVKNLTVLDADGLKRLDNVSFTAYGGEILGVAGITGSGQRELLEAVAGLQRVESGGSIRLITPDGKQEELAGRDPLEIYKLGVGLAFVPEDRFGMGLVASMDLIDNVMLRSYKQGKSFFTDRKAPRKLAQSIVEQLEVVTPSLRTPIRRLSGGNVQKMLVGREIAGNPSLLMTAYAVRGLDVRTTQTIFRLLNEQKEKGTAVIYVGEDLDVLLELCDRILVLCAGKLSGIVDARTAKKEELGLMMTHVGEEAAV